MPLISIHIPKTGGTTFLDLLSSHYRHKLLLDYGLSDDDGPQGVNSGTYDCVHGHFIADKYVNVKRAEFVFWLRNPIQRLFSQYYFWKSHKFPHSFAWRRFHFEQWSFADFALSPSVQNEQSRYIGSLNIDSAKVIGITEFFNESMELFCDALGMKVDFSTIPEHRKNSAVAAGSSYEIQDKRLEAAILDFHHKDYELYLRGLALFRKRYDLLSDKLSKAYAGKSRRPADPVSIPLSLQKLLRDKGLNKIVATYYYGDGWPINVWDTFRRDVADTWLEKIQADGFNTVILLIPASISKLRLLSAEHYREFLADLSFMMKKIDDRNMYSMFRLGFSWDGFPIRGDRGHGCFSILAGGEERARAKEAFDELYELTTSHRGFLYAFITWEDMLMFAWNRATRASEDMRRTFARELGYMNQSEMVPTTDSPEFKDYLDFIDTKFSDLFYDLKKVFPPLSAEVRVDTTPFSDAKGKSHHYVHNRQFVETDCDVIGTYFGTYMIHGDATAKQAINAMNIAHGNLRRAAPAKRIFVDQLLMVIEEKQFNHYPKLDHKQLQSYFDMLPEWLEQHGIGYATWSFSDYLWDILFNGTFKYGLQGWALEGAPKLIAREAERHVVLKTGDSIRGERIEHFSPWIKDGLVLIEADIEAGSSVQVTLSDGIRLILSDADFSFAPDRKARIAIAPFQGQSAYIKISMLNGSAKIKRVGLGKEIISNGGHTLKLENRDTARMIADLNAKYQAL